MTAVRAELNLLATIWPRSTVDKALAALEAYGTDPSPLLRWVELALESERPGLGRLLLEEATRERPWGPREEACLAQVLVAQGKGDEAAEVLQALLRSSPGDPEVGRAVAAVYLAANRLEEARPWLEQALAAAPPDGMLQFRMAHFHAAEGNAAEARRWSGQAEASLGEEWPLQPLLGELAFREGDVEAALGFGIAAVKGNPMHPSGVRLLAKAYSEAGELEKAELLLKGHLEAVPDSSVQPTLVRLQAHLWETRKQAAVAVRPGRERRVVFVCDEPRVRQCKLAAGLRELGWKVHLLRSRARPPECELEPFFDEVQAYWSPFEAMAMAREADALAIHAFSPWVDETTLAFVQDKPGKVVYDYTDVLSEIRVEDPAMVENQRRCIEQADALCCRDLRLRHVVRSKGWTLPPRRMMFLDYCWDGAQELLPRRQDGLHVVSIGSFGIERYGQFDNGYLEIARLLADQGIHFHLYPVPRQLQHGDSFEEAFSDYLDLGARTGLVHMHRPLPMDRVVKEISQYHLGVNVVQALSFGRQLTGYSPAHFRYCGSARVFDYLDAGLPVLLNRDFLFQYRPLARYGLVLEGSGPCLGNLRASLEGLYQGDVEARLQEMRRLYSIGAQAHRLAEFYGTL